MKPSLSQGIINFVYQLGKKKSHLLIGTLRHGTSGANYAVT